MEVLTAISPIIGYESEYSTHIHSQYRTFTSEPDSASQL